MRIRKGLKAYLNTDLGIFYAHNTNRLMLYPLIFCFFLLEGVVIWLLYKGPTYYLGNLAFTTIYSLHKSAGNTISIWIADVLANLLAPAWGAFAKRTVGRQWLIWSLGLAAGFMPFRAVARRLVLLYAPDIAAYYIANPQAKLGILTILIFLIPCWTAAIFMTLRIAMSKQRVHLLEKKIVVTAGDNTTQATTTGGDSPDPPSGWLRLNQNHANLTIALADITHVTVEDHYCRINYWNGNRLKSELIRLPLGKLILKLPPEHFLKIHRSHVVNRSHIARIAKKGRDRKVHLQVQDVELPVSRSRFKALSPYLTSCPQR